MDLGICVWHNYIFFFRATDMLFLRDLPICYPYGIKIMVVVFSDRYAIPTGYALLITDMISLRDMLYIFFILSFLHPLMEILETAENRDRVFPRMHFSPLALLPSNRTSMLHRPQIPSIRSAHPILHSIHA